MRATPEDERRWAAVLAHDLRADGAFVYAVRSTGIYCRPSCPSRRPHRRHVVFYRQADEAERAGFRACKRCHPRWFEEVREKQRLEEELKVAAAIQERLRPAAPPRADGWELAGSWKPCRQVGGDYYDFIECCDRGRLAAALGDVSGKGPGAALLMSSLHAAVRAQSQLGLRPSQVVEAVNRYLCENSPGDKFVTLFYLEVELGTGRVAYVNAGHPPALLRRADGDLVVLNGGGVPLGIVPGVEYPQGEARLEPGDALVLYSDGVSELTNGRGEEFGERRIAAAVRAGDAGTAEALCAELRDKCLRFGGQAPGGDDRTLVVVKRTVATRARLGEGTLTAGRAVSLV